MSIDQILTILFFCGAITLYALYFLHIYPNRPKNLEAPTSVKNIPIEQSAFELKRISHTVRLDEGTISKEKGSLRNICEPVIKEALMEDLSKVIEFQQYFPKSGGVEITGQIFIGVRRK